jgi:hypothetical protein
MKLYIGVDIGLTGGVAVLCDEELMLFPMPTIAKKKGGHIYDTKSICSLIKGQSHIAYMAIEKAGLSPQNGKKAIQSLAYCEGIFDGIASTLGIPFEIVNPIHWQHLILGRFPKGESKSTALRVAQRRFPSADFKRTERCKKADDGLVDAALIALYARTIQP